MSVRKLASGFLVLAAATLIAGAALPAQAAAQQRSRLYWNTPDKMGETVPGAAAKLTRDDHGVRVSLRTGLLKPGHAYTMWWIAFNHPQYCAANPARAFNPSGACGLPDVFSPLTGASHIWGAGAVIGSNGIAVFSSRLRKGQAAEFPWEPGLTNPAGAEFYLIVRDHGPAVKGSDQTTSLNGGCVPVPPGHGSAGTYGCSNEQMAFFPAP
jgi:hypothetical protein